MSRYMLDTNIAGFLVRGNYRVLQRVIDAPEGSLCVSSITRGEIAFGLRRRAPGRALENALQEFWRRVDVLPWDADVADTYGYLRAEMERIGKPLGALDMMIASHAVQVGAVLVTNDHAFGAVPSLDTEDWTKMGRGYP